MYVPRNPKNTNNKLLSLFRSNKNIQELLEIIKANLTNDLMKFNIEETIFDRVHSYIPSEDDDNIPLNPYITMDDELNRLNTQFIEMTLANYIRDKHLFNEIINEPIEDFAYSAFIADSLRPPGFEHFNDANLHEIRENRNPGQIQRQSHLYQSLAEQYDPHIHKLSKLHSPDYIDPIAAIANKDTFNKNPYERAPYLVTDARVNANFGPIDWGFKKEKHEEKNKEKEQFLTDKYISFSLRSKENENQRPRHHIIRTSREYEPGIENGISIKESGNLLRGENMVYYPSNLPSNPRSGFEGSGFEEIEPYKFLPVENYAIV